MKTSLVARLWLGLALLGLPGLAPAELILGDPPRAPENVSELPRGPAALVNGGYSVDTASRERARAFYNAIFLSSEGVAIGSTANIGGCVSGDESAAFREAVLRRINWFRAMAGVPASITLNPGWNSTNQATALIMSANNSLSHFPPASWTCYTSAGDTGAQNSNLALGSNGPDSISGYLEDPYANNTAVGHRRWLLYPQTKIMGVGDMPAQGNYSPANAVWVFDGNFGGPRPATRTPYVAWPPAGYVPQRVVPVRWSFSYPDANFNSATISMASNGVPLAVTRESLQQGYGENALVWFPSNLDPNQPGSWPFTGKDTTYSVTIASVQIGSVLSNFSYTVTVFDPAQPGPDTVPTVISGSAQPGIGINNPYAVSPYTNATGYQWRWFKRAPFTFTDGAESGSGNWIVETDGSYSVITTDPVYGGSRAFQLGHPMSSLLAPPPRMTLKSLLWPAANASLQFQSRLLYASSNEFARVQASTNDGPWFNLFTQAGSNDSGEPAWNLRSIPLGGYAGSTLRIRFSYDQRIGTYYPGPSSIVGWHFDAVTLSNCEQLTTGDTNAVADPGFWFTPSQPGNYLLQARPLIYTDFPLEWGPPAKATAVAYVPPQISAAKISRANSQILIDFSVASGSSASFTLLSSTNLSAWRADASAVLATNPSAPAAWRFTTAPAASARFYRVQAP